MIQLQRQTVVHHGHRYLPSQLAGRDFYMPERTAVEIEGELITTSPEKLGVSTDGNGGRELPPTVPILGQEILIKFEDTDADYYPGLSRRGFSNTSYPLYTATLLYGDESLDLTFDTPASDKPVLFTGVKGSFLACDPRMNGDNRDYMVVGVDHEALQETPGKLSSIWHELGHIAIFDREFDVDATYAAQSGKKEFIPRLPRIDDYVEELKRSVASHDSWVTTTGDLWLKLIPKRLSIQKAVFLLHEHKAWEFGKQMKDSLGAPDGFKDPDSYRKYAYACLASYSRYYRDERFHRGMKYRK